MGRDKDRYVVGGSAVDEPFDNRWAVVAPLSAFDVNGPGTYVVTATWQDDNRLRYNPHLPASGVDLTAPATNDGSLSVQTTVVLVAVEFARDQPPWVGFDFKTRPLAWQVVPSTGTRTVERVVMPAAAGPHVYRTSDLPTSLTVAPATGAGATTLTGQGRVATWPLHTAVHARLNAANAPPLVLDGVSTGTLGVCVRNQRVVQLDFHLFNDQATHGTTVTQSAIPSIIDGLNTIWMPQANIVFHAHEITSYTLAGNWGDYIEWGDVPPPWVDESGAITLFRCTEPGHLNVYLVWNFRWWDPMVGWDSDVGFADPAYPDAVLRNGANVIPDLAHELGHLLGLWGPPYADYYDPATLGDELMHAGGTGTLIRHFQVDALGDGN